MDTIRDRLECPPDVTTYRWAHDLYPIIPKSNYKFKGVIDGPDGFPYLVVYPVRSGFEDEAIYSFDRLALAAKEANAGIAIYRNKKLGTRPEFTLSFGSIWAFIEYGHLEGAGQLIFSFEKAMEINPIDPYHAEIDPENDKIMIGMPSEQFFPLYVRDLMTAQIRKYVPDAVPEFCLYEQEKLALRTSVFVTVGSDWPIDEVGQKLISELNWLSPPYLPVMIK